jgi:hypothetical protein
MGKVTLPPKGGYRVCFPPGEYLPHAEGVTYT